MKNKINIVLGTLGLAGTLLIGNIASASQAIENYDKTVFPDDM